MPSFHSTCSMPFSSATSDPGRRGRCKSARSAVSVQRGSATITVTRSVSASLRRRIRLNVIGWQSAVFVPIRKKQSASSMSAYAVGGPSAPSERVYPAAAEAMHSREFVSKLLVPMNPFVSLPAT